MEAVSFAGEPVVADLRYIRIGTADTAPHTSRKTITAAILAAWIEFLTAVPASIVLNMIKELVYEEERL